MYRLPILETKPMWVATERPPPLVCPRTYCFHFLEAGNQFAPGRHLSLDDAMDKLITATEDSCKGTFGRCNRGGLEGEQDLYEPHEPFLERDGLPWFYFITSVDNLIEELHDQYLAESAALWRLPT